MPASVKYSMGPKQFYLLLHLSNGEAEYQAISIYHSNINLCTHTIYHTLWLMHANYLTPTLYDVQKPFLTQCEATQTW